MNLTSTFLIILCISRLGTVSAGEFCKSRGGPQYCGGGCCKEGSSPCCHDIDNILRIVYIVCGVIGGIILVSLTVAIICWCISYSRSRRREGMIVGQMRPMTLSQVRTQGVVYPPTNAVMYSQPTMVTGTSPPQPPPYQSPPNTSPPGYQPNPKCYPAGFNSDVIGNQSTEKQDSKTSAILMT